MKKTVHLIAVVLVVAMMLTAFAACGNTGDANNNEPSQQADTTPPAKTEEGQPEKTFTIGSNNFLKGVYSVDILEKNFMVACDALGVEGFVANDEASVENSVKNVEDMIASGVDAILFFGISDTLFPVVAEKCEAAGIPFAFFDHMPTDDVLAQVQQYEHYVGIAATVDMNTGREAGEYALSQGATKAIVVTGETTDTTHSARTNGFIEAFTAGGGQVLAEGYGNVAIADAMTRANDLLTAYPEADFVYATNGDVGTACMEALAKHTNVNAQLYVTDLDPDVLTGLESGAVAAANGAHWVNVYYATALLVNHLYGNSLKEADGSAPRLVVPVMTLPNNLLDLYNKCWINSSPYTVTELQSFSAPFNPTVTLDDLRSALEEYTIINRLNALVEQGVITQAELDAALAG